MFHIYRKPVTRTKGYFDQYGKRGLETPEAAKRLVEQLAKILPGYQFLAVNVIDAPGRLPIKQAMDSCQFYCFIPEFLASVPPSMPLKTCPDCGTGFYVPAPNIPIVCPGCGRQFIYETEEFEEDIPF